MNKVKVYSTQACYYCNILKDFLNEQKIEFEEIDVSQDQEMQKEMIEKSGQMGVPVIEINGEIIVGFDQVKIKKLLKIE